MLLPNTWAAGNSQFTDTLIMWDESQAAHHNTAMRKLRDRVGSAEEGGLQRHLNAGMHLEVLGAFS